MKREFSAADLRQSMKAIENDARARALAQSCVAYAMQEHGPVDPERADRDAHDIASMATHLLVSRFYLEDAELRSLREENARLRQQVEELVHVTPGRIRVLART